MCSRRMYRIREVISLITVEPTMILYMMAFMTTSLVEQALFVDKACRVNHNFSAEICGDITNPKYKEYNKQVQITVSEFHQWNDIAGHVIPIILAFFIGAWSDKRGRKIPLLLGLIGKLYYSCMVIVNCLQDTWPVEYLIYTATFPSTLTGADVAIFAAAFTYLFDVSSPTNRTLRVTILEVCYLATMPTGIALGSYLFSKVTNRSFTIMFTINASMLFLSIIYSMVFLKWRTSNTQRPLREASCIVTDFFDYKHVVSTFHTMSKPRAMARRTYLLLMIVAMGFYSFQRDEKDMSYLFFQLEHQWTFEQNSNFRTFLSAIQDVILLTAIPFMSKVLAFRDTLIMIIGALCHSIARVFYIAAEVDWLIYVGGAFAACGPIVAPVIRSITSKLVAENERGQAFAMLSVTDNAIKLFSGIVYNQVYKATIHTQPAAIFGITIATQITVFLIASYIQCHASDTQLCHKDEDDNDVTNPLT